MSRASAVLFVGPVEPWPVLIEAVGKGRSIEYHRTAQAAGRAVRQRDRRWYAIVACSSPTEREGLGLFESAAVRALRVAKVLLSDGLDADSKSRASAIGVSVVCKTPCATVLRFLLRSPPSNNGLARARELACADLASWSRREADVLELRVRGFEQKEIATQLRISLSTVRTYVRRIQAKSGARSLDDVVRPIRERRLAR